MRGRAELMAFHSQYGIVTEGYSALTPLTKRPGGPVSKVVAKLAAKYDISDAQVLLNWVKGKGVGSVT
jgi:diketogulonate reductase-like aldo/keto reductase